jgi:hypothetical protein
VKIPTIVPKKNTEMDNAYQRGKSDQTATARHIYNMHSDACVLGVSGSSQSMYTIVPVDARSRYGLLEHLVLVVDKIDTSFGERNVCRWYMDETKGKGTPKEQPRHQYLDDVTRSEDQLPIARKIVKDQISKQHLINDFVDSTSGSSVSNCRDRQRHALPHEPANLLLDWYTWKSTEPGTLKKSNLVVL